MEEILKAIIVPDSDDMMVYGNPQGDSIIEADVPKGIRDCLIPDGKKIYSFGILRTNDYTGRLAQEIDVYNYFAHAIFTEPRESGQGWYHRHGSIERTSAKRSLKDNASDGTPDKHQPAFALSNLEYLLNFDSLWGLLLPEQKFFITREKDLRLLSYALDKDFNDGMILSYSLKGESYGKERELGRIMIEYANK